MNKAVPLKHVSVDYELKYIGESTLELEHGNIYKCVAEHYDNNVLHSLSVIDDSGEDYIYMPDMFVHIDKQAVNKTEKSIA